MAQATIATTVTGLQGHPVSNTAPSVVGQLLTWNGSAWAPDNTTYMPVAGGTFTGPVTLAGAATQANQPATLTQVATAAGVNIGRNYLLNAMFNVNQRVSASYGVAVGGTYSADTWVGNIGGGGDTYTISFAAASDADRAAIGDQVVLNYMSSAITGGAGAANYITIAQPIEDVSRLSNKQVTLSFWAYSPTSLRVGVSYTQNFGIGGSPSNVVQANVGVVQLTAGWQRYQLTWTMASMAGQTLGTTAFTSFTAINFWLSCPPANTTNYAISGNLGAQTGTINIWGTQLELGNQATPFEHRDPVTDWALCQRYFCAGQIVSGAYQDAGATVYSPAFFAVMMRVTPTVVTEVNNNSNLGPITWTPMGYGYSINGTCAYGNVTNTGGCTFNMQFFASADFF